MPCYHPLIRIENSHKYEKAIDGHKYRKAIIINPDDDMERLEDIKNSLFYNYTIIPCRKCIGCRLDYSREWANRGYLEAKCWANNYFVTLTYDDENIKMLDTIETSNGITFTQTDTWKHSLISKDFTKFLHDLRRLMERTQKNQNIRFLGCGEYGEQGQRPHYHIILFNCNLPTESFYKARIINEEVYWQNTIIEKCWKKGISNISAATWNTIAYTARYITKKINGEGSEELYASNGLIKEFLRMSKNPGIGYYYYEKNKDKIYKLDKITIKNKNGVIECKPPKYFDKLYEAEYPEKFAEISKKREKWKKNNDKLLDLQTSNSRQERLNIAEETHEGRNQKLIRSFEKVH